MNAIEIRGLCKRYPGFALEDVSLSLPTGSILGLVGENGAGKSTMLKLVMDAIPRDAGSVRVLGVDNRSGDFRALKQDIGVVLDEACFPEVLTAENIGAILRRTYVRWDDAAYHSWLQRFDLPKNKPCKDLSRGMKMKLVIATALSHSPRLLLLDEATSGLDPFVRDEILEVFNDFTRDEGHSILISSHIVSDLEKVCDYIAFLHHGRLLFCEEKDRLLEEYAIVRLPAADFAALDEQAVIGAAPFGHGGMQALVHKGSLPAGVLTEHSTLEEIILFLAKGEKGQ